MTTAPKSFQPGEVLLVHVASKPAFFVRVEDIEPDHKKGWWQLRLLVLALPLQSITWILDNDQIRGAEFTMQGHAIRLERIAAPGEKEDQDTTHDQQTSRQGGRVVSLFDED